jgi:ribosome-associated protein
MSIDDENELSLEKSKTRKKHEANALQALGTELTQLNEEQLHRIPLPQNLLDAILAAQKIHQHGGRKRQLQYIGKLMRDIDPQPIKQALQHIQLQHKRDTAVFHQIETWRDQLLQNSPTVINELMTRFPDLDMQHVRQLVRNAGKEANRQKPAKSARALFKYLLMLHNNANINPDV